MDAKRERPPADEGRERMAREIFPFADTSPAEYAARHAAGWAVFSFAEYQYSDDQLDRWIQEFGAILLNPDRVLECQREYLTPEEFARERQRMTEEL